MLLWSIYPYDHVVDGGLECIQIVDGALELVVCVFVLHSKKFEASHADRESLDRFKLPFSD